MAIGLHTAHCVTGSHQRNVNQVLAQSFRLESRHRGRSVGVRMVRRIKNRYTAIEPELQRFMLYYRKILQLSRGW